jgi:hypothetical protein
MKNQRMFTVLTLLNLVILIFLLLKQLKPVEASTDNDTSRRRARNRRCSGKSAGLYPDCSRRPGTQGRRFHCEGRRDVPRNSATSLNSS